MLTYGVPADFLDDCLAIGESTTIESLRHFVKAMIEIFGSEYLRALNEQDTARLLAMNKARGFLGMLGSIDCMHWKWKNCPPAWHRQFIGHAHDPTIILEAVVDQELWIWHAYFGMPGSCNDINVLPQSPIFARLAKGESPVVEFEANGHKHMEYYLADGTYPSLSSTKNWPQWTYPVVISIRARRCCGNTRSRSASPAEPPRPRRLPQQPRACLLQLRLVDHEAVAQERFFALLALDARARRHRNPSAAAVDARRRRQSPPLSPRPLSPAICADKWSRRCGHDPALMERPALHDMHAQFLANFVVTGLLKVIRVWGMWGLWIRIMQSHGIVHDYG
ncbi:hypothetical protein EJB05_34787, partial [Eragrostis curvula]